MEFRVGRADTYYLGREASDEALARDKDLDVRKKVSVLQIDSGTRLYFRLQVANKGSEPVRHIVIDNPIPPGTHYLEESAGGARTQIEFSTDEGQTWARPHELLREIDDGPGKSLQVACAEDYTNIRWTLDEIPPGRMEELYFQVTICQ